MVQPHEVLLLEKPLTTKTFCPLRDKWGYFEVAWILKNTPLEKEKHLHTTNFLGSGRSFSGVYLVQYLKCEDCKC